MNQWLAGKRTGLKYPLLLLRTLLFLLFTTLGLTLLFITALVSGKRTGPGLFIRQWWCRIMTQVAGIHTRVEGEVKESLFLLVSNHRCYTDPVISLQHARAFPVAKAEVADWPIIGFAARATGVIFVKRKNRESRRRTVTAIEQSLRAGLPVLIYPEGTTSSLPGTTQFKLGSFRVAARLGIPVIPCAIDYQDSNIYWVEDDTFLGHVNQEFGKWRINCRVRYGPAIQNEDPAKLMEECQEWIDAQIREFWKDWGREQHPPPVEPDASHPSS